MKRLPRDFYIEDAVDVAKKLLGKYIVREYDGKKLIAKIVETEAYKAMGDKAAHMNNNKITQRTKIAFEVGGHAYIYLIYGMYYCFNIVTCEKGVGGAVLVRGVEPIDGIKDMMLNRYNKVEEKKSKVKNITNGPGKLCMALNIDKSFYGEDLCTSDKLYITEGEIVKGKEIVQSKRINIDYAQEAKDFLWRFYR
ncbi:DNA-3-methyladenine glycosylase [Tepidibacter formicigenes]|jgi:DNA-3-methyladenine glycosylase|uniref:Putative 3-methyladenine DNA glycosylase n=1 Tax=Tepidibacter formicigenes DSM 15518 TaxID=1123349 RepID=A0A1M6TWD5_9FIRM|nr:DNA-3-methyladenine glycosylase [Tepidibacter formicigenes]SHK61200.1 DNA-3-methyladenine glycosylase [Tepidibacter formicigenes DSM 15518]